MPESIQHNQKPSGNAPLYYHKTIVRWPVPLWRRVNTAAREDGLDFSSFVKAATLRALEERAAKVA